MTHLVLASSSAYRGQLLSRITGRFIQKSPAIDESPMRGELADDLVVRLARLKAQKVAVEMPSAWIIGSDQVVTLNNQLFGKPGNFANAVKQLELFSGKSVTFRTAVCLQNLEHNWSQWSLTSTQVTFRELKIKEIEHYLHIEQPYDCAGSFKSEGLGISLFESVQSRDPTALIGLPLISLTRLMRAAKIFDLFAGDFSADDDISL